MIRSRISTALVLLAALVGFFCFDISIDEGKVAFGGQMVVKADSPTVTLEFSTFLGPSSSIGYAELWESVYDSAGNIVVIGGGDIRASGYPAGVTVTTFGTIDNSNIVVAKLSADGSRLLWVTLLGGNGVEKEADGIAIDSSDNIYISAGTFTTDFPTTPGAFDRTFNGGGQTEAIVAKLSADGQTLLYSTYLGGSQSEEASRGGIAVDDQGFVYAVGYTKSPDFLENASSGRPANKVNSYIGGVGDGFIVKLSQDGSSVVYARFIGSPNDTNYGDVVVGVQVDQQKNTYLHALVRGSGAVTTADAYDKTFATGGSEPSDGYFMKLSSDGSTVLYATYLGGTGSDWPEHRLALDTAGNIYLVGTTTGGFPMINAHDSSHNGGEDGYLVKLNPAGQPEFSTYIGTPGDDTVLGPAIDKAGNIFVAGYAKAAGLETTPDAYDDTFNGVRDIILQQYSPSGQLLYSTYFGGSGFDRARFVASASDGNPIVVGYTESADFPTTPGAYDRTHRGGVDIFVAKFAASSSTPPTPPNLVKINGPPIGLLNSNHIFTASVEPVNATQPITFVWQATDQTQITHANVSSSGDMATFNWNTGGTKTIRVIAVNSVGTVVDTHPFIASQNVESVYLPTILKMQ